MADASEEGYALKEIILLRGEVALVDDADYPRLSPYRWHLVRAGKCVYVARSGGSHDARPIMMHRQLLNLGTGEMCDHRNGNGLDNRRENLRRCTPLQNNRNRRPATGRQWKGYCRCKYPLARPFMAQIRVNGKRIYLGHYASEREAAEAYNRAAKEHFGEFARLNDFARATR